MLSDSRVREILAVHAVDRNGVRLVVNGDEGYGRGNEVLAPFRGNLTEEQRAYNESMRTTASYRRMGVLTIGASSTTTQISGSVFHQLGCMPNCSPLFKLREYNADLFPNETSACP